MTTPVTTPQPTATEAVTPLVVYCDQQPYRITATPATIGRGSDATVHLDYSWLSRTHLRLECTEGTWQATDTSTHGIFVNGQQVTTVAITDGLEMHLGAADGVAIMFALAEATGRRGDDRAPTPSSSSAPAHAGEAAEPTDPGLQRVGAAITARRRELGFTQEEFAAEKILSVAPLIAIEKGRSWPHASTRAKLEAKLQWPPGTIDNIRSGLATAPSDETTHVINPDAQVSMLARTISVALKRIDDSVSALPAPSEPAFLVAAEGILADLNDLRGIAEDAAENHHTPVVELATTLLAIRRRIDDLLALTARSPQATLGRRLQVLRRQRGLNIDDIALMGRLPADVVAQAEADAAISADHYAALRALVDQIA